MRRMEYAVALGAPPGSSIVVLFHHSPRRTDDMLDEIAGRYRSATKPSVVVATEGAVIEC